MIDSPQTQLVRLSRRDFRNIVLLILISILMFCLAPDLRGLWVLDEVRYGEAVRSMTETGRIFTPHLNGEIYSDKPPLFFWYLIIFARLAGTIKPWVFFLATSMSGIACVVALYALGRLIYDSSSAFLASLVLLSSLLFIGLAQFVRMDLLMLLFIILAFHAFAKALKTGNRKHYYLVYIYLALSVLTKGPVGVFIVLAAILAFLIHSSRAREISRLRLPQGIIIIVLITGIWLGLTILESGTGYIRSVWSVQLVGRAVQSWIHSRPVYYYLLWMPIAFLPWIAYLPRAFVRCVRRGDDLSKLPAWWAVAALVVLSVISYKIFIYLLLLLPALSLMVGRFLTGSITRERETSFGIENAITAIILFLVGIITVLPWLYGLSGFPSVLGRWLGPANCLFLGSGAALLPVAIVSFVSFLLLVGSSVMGRQQVVVTVLVITMLCISTSLARIVVPRIDPVMCPKDYCGKIAEYKDRGFAVAEYRVEFGILNYYAGTNMARLRTLEDILEFLDENPRAVIAITDNHWRLNRESLNTVDVAVTENITGNSPEKTFHLLVQDGDLLRPLADALREYENDGYAVAIYKNKDIPLNHYLDDGIVHLSTQEELTGFFEEHDKAAVVASLYRRRREKSFLKDLRVTNRTDFYHYRYYILLKQPEE